MIACAREDRNWSDKKKDGDDGFRTLECLRGRLLAERQASRSAKKDAELMGNKLIELEKLLKEEIKLKNRAEKKLKLLKKKLESLRISKEQLGSCQNSEISCRSSTTGTNSKNPEEQEPNKENSSPQATANSNSSSKSNETSSNKSSQSYEDSKIYDQESSSSSKAPEITEMEMEDNDFVDDTWALVPVTWPWPPAKPEAIEPTMISSSVGEVLDVLRHARERLKCSVERRRLRYD